ncbi:hypothetical protein G7K_0719-t1 [Saitoella complicata NRRL Y-17804]|uniref:mitogen-activated protein kinase kinase kinase n=2 Tax=Saitoella complicata (strain BCRC 22490 / CBS 7301 / JCM 7358 / NBRC 10748 / NRRL Y-17804) TaxID=698492 RepID=A0A0E9N9L9_SAICN|nr:hypothetical protein G7K_0719-t1 [Saitoella complicata NRRL Y-17804]
MLPSSHRPSTSPPPAPLAEEGRPRPGPEPQPQKGPSPGPYALHRQTVIGRRRAKTDTTIVQLQGEGVPPDAPRHPTTRSSNDIAAVRHVSSPAIVGDERLARGSQSVPMPTRPAPPSPILSREASGFAPEERRPTPIVPPRKVPDSLAVGSSMITSPPFLGAGTTLSSSPPMARHAFPPPPAPSRSAGSSPSMDMPPLTTIKRRVASESSINPTEWINAQVLEWLRRQGFERDWLDVFQAHNIEGKRFADLVSYPKVRKLVPPRLAAEGTKAGAELCNAVRLLLEASPTQQKPTVSFEQLLAEDETTKAAAGSPLLSVNDFLTSNLAPPGQDPDPKLTRRVSHSGLSETIEAQNHAAYRRRLQNLSDSKIELSAHNHNQQRLRSSVGYPYGATPLFSSGPVGGHVKSPSLESLRAFWVDTTTLQQESGDKDKSSKEKGLFKMFRRKDKEKEYPRSHSRQSSDVSAPGTPVTAQVGKRPSLGQHRESNASTASQSTRKSDPLSTPLSQRGHGNGSTPTGQRNRGRMLLVQVTRDAEQFFVVNLSQYSFAAELRRGICARVGFEDDIDNAALFMTDIGDLHHEKKDELTNDKLMYLCANGDAKGTLKFFVQDKSSPAVLRPSWYEEATTMDARRDSLPMSPPDGRYALTPNYMYPANYNREAVSANVTPRSSDPDKHGPGSVEGDYFRISLEGVDVKDAIAEERRSQELSAIRPQWQEAVKNSPEIEISPPSALPSSSTEGSAPRDSYHQGIMGALPPSVPDKSATFKFPSSTHSPVLQQRPQTMSDPVVYVPPAPAQRRSKNGGFEFIRGARGTPDVLENTPKLRQQPLQQRPPPRRDDGRSHSEPGGDFRVIRPEQSRIVNFDAPRSSPYAPQSEFGAPRLSVNETPASAVPYRLSNASEAGLSREDSLSRRDSQKSLVPKRQAPAAPAMTDDRLQRLRNSLSLRKPVPGEKISSESDSYADHGTMSIPRKPVPPRSLTIPIISKTEPEGKTISPISTSGLTGLVALAAGSAMALASIPAVPVAAQDALQDVQENTPDSPVIGTSLGARRRNPLKLQTSGLPGLRPKKSPDSPVETPKYTTAKSGMLFRVPTYDEGQDESEHSNSRSSSTVSFNEHIFDRRKSSLALPPQMPIVDDETPVSTFPGKKDPFAEKLISFADAPTLQIEDESDDDDELFAVRPSGQREEVSISTFPGKLDPFSRNSMDFADAPALEDSDSDDDDNLFALKPAEKPARDPPVLPQITRHPTLMRASSLVKPGTRSSSRPSLRVRIGGSSFMAPEYAIQESPDTPEYFKGDDKGGISSGSSRNIKSASIQPLPSRAALPQNSPVRRQSMALREDVWAVRPPPDVVYDNLEDFFPDHDLDTPIVENDVDNDTPPSSPIPNGGRPRSGVPPPAFPPPPAARHSSAASLRQSGRMKSIRVVAKEASEARKRFASAAAGPKSSAALLRRKSTKLWGTRLIEMTPSQIKQGEIPKPETSGLQRKPTFAWVKGELIGQGTYGKVYLAMNANTGEMLAVKQVEVPKSLVGSDERQSNLVGALNSEIETMKDLDHFNIVQYLGCERTDTTVSIFLEYVPGGSVGRCLRKNGKLPMPVIRSLTRQTLEGLAYLHNRGILHRDLKADNLLLDHDGVCKISDFGISKRSADVYGNDANMSVMQGTIFWMAPEVIQNQKQGYSAKIDIWSLGCVVLEMLAGRRPWSNDEAIGAMFKLGNARQAPPIPPDVEAYMTPEARDFLDKCFTIDPARRPTAQVLLQHPFCEWQSGYNFLDYFF